MLWLVYSFFLCVCVCVCVSLVAYFYYTIPNIGVLYIYNNNNNNKSQARGVGGTAYLEPTATEEARSSRGPTGGGERHCRPTKNDRDKNMLTVGKSSRVHRFQEFVSRQNLDSNQSN